MAFQVGDRVVAESESTARAPRTGTVLEVLRGDPSPRYRRAVLEDAQIDELRTRTAPEQLARDLSQDARKRGL